MPTNDCIKRSDAVYAVYERIRQIGMEGNPYVLSIRQAVRDVPAADVEPKSEIVPWKVAGPFDDFHQCTKCGNMWPIFSTVEWAYCPVCGCRKLPDPPKSWTDNPWCNAVAKALESLKGEDDAEVR